MPKQTIYSPLSIRVSNEVKDMFEDSFRISGSSSKGEFLSNIIDAYNASLDDPTPTAVLTPAQTQITEKVIEKERELKENEILLSLNPAQFFTLKETVLANPKFVTVWNEHIKKMKDGDSPFLYFGNLCDKDYGCIWNEFKELESNEDLTTLKSNMAAELINSYMVRIIEGEIDYSVVTPKLLKKFIKEEKEKTSKK